MKKKIFALAAFGFLAIGTQQTFAQENPTQTEQTNKVEKKNKKAKKQMTSDAEFDSIDILALPQSVKDATMTNFNAIASEAWVKMHNNQKLYKLKVSTDGESKTVYVTEDGKWLKREEVADKQE